MTMLIFDREHGWRGVEEEADYDEHEYALCFQGEKYFPLEDEGYGSFKGYAFLVFQNTLENKKPRYCYLIEFLTPRESEFIAIPKTPDLLEFFRLYLPVLKALRGYTAISYERGKNGTHSPWDAPKVNS